MVPWVLDNVISGSPILFEPFVESARFAAAHRNHHWQYVRQTRLDTGIEEPEGIRPYPARAALDRLRRKVEDTTDLPSPKAQSALAIIQELETILDLSD